MRTRAVVCALLGAIVLAGCGSPSPDLFVVERTGAVPGARLTLIIDDGGFVRCNGGDRQQISSDQLIDAREIARALNGASEEEPGLVDKQLNLPPKSGSILRYNVRSEGGTVAFADNSAGQPQDFFRIAALTRVLAKGECGLQR